MLVLLSSVDVVKTPLCGVGQGKPALPSLCGTRFEVLASLLSSERVV